LREAPRRFLSGGSRRESGCVGRMWFAKGNLEIGKEILEDGLSPLLFCCFLDLVEVNGFEDSEFSRLLSDWEFLLFSRVE